LLLKPLKGYTNGWVISISFAQDVPGGRKSRASAIAIVANNGTFKKRSVISCLSVSFFFALSFCLEYNPESSALKNSGSLAKKFSMNPIDRGGKRSFH